MNYRRINRHPGCISAHLGLVVIVPLIFSLGCGSGAPLVPDLSTGKAKVEQPTTKVVGKGRNRQVLRDHDEESNSERFARRAREAEEARKKVAQ